MTLHLALVASIREQSSMHMLPLKGLATMQSAFNNAGETLIELSAFVR